MFQCAFFYSLFAPGVYTCPWFRCSVVIFTSTVNSAPRVWYERSSCVGKVFFQFSVCLFSPCLFFSWSIHVPAFGCSVVIFASRVNSTQIDMKGSSVKKFWEMFWFSSVPFLLSSVRYWSHKFTWMSLFDRHPSLHRRSTLQIEMKGPRVLSIFSFFEVSSLHWGLM